MALFEHLPLAILSSEAKMQTRWKKHYANYLRLISLHLFQHHEWIEEVFNVKQQKRNLQVQFSCNFILPLPLSSPSLWVKKNTQRKRLKKVDRSLRWKKIIFFMQNKFFLSWIFLLFLLEISKMEIHNFLLLNLKFSTSWLCNDDKLWFKIWKII